MQVSNSGLQSPEKLDGGAPHSSQLQGEEQLDGNLVGRRFHKEGPKSLVPKSEESWWEKESLEESADEVESSSCRQE